MGVISKYPVTCFIVISKLLWISGFLFTIYIIENHMPNLRQFILASIYTLLTLPFNYWLTYGFGVKNSIEGKNNKDLQIILKDELNKIDSKRKLKY